MTPRARPGGAPPARDSSTFAGVARSGRCSTSWAPPPTDARPDQPPTAPFGAGAPGGIRARPGRRYDLHVGPPGIASRSARRDGAAVGRRPRRANRESVRAPDRATTKREQAVAVLSRGRDQDSGPARRAADLP